MSIPTFSPQQRQDPGYILKVKPVQAAVDNRGKEYKKARRFELSKRFKKTQSIDIAKPASVNLNVWMLTSKKKKKILFDSVNKDIYASKQATKSRFRPEDFVFKHPRTGFMDLGKTDKQESAKLY